MARGARNPGKADTVLEKPKMMPAKGGAMSIWFTWQAEYWKPVNPTASVSRMTAMYGFSQDMKPAPTRNAAGGKVPETYISLITRQPHININVVVSQDTKEI